MHLGNSDSAEMNFSVAETDAINAMLEHQKATERIGYISLGLGVVGAGIGIAVAPKPPRPWVWGAVAGFALVSTVADLFLSYRHRQIEYNKSNDSLGGCGANCGCTTCNGLGGTPRCPECGGVSRQTFPFPPGGTSGLGNLGKPQRMESEAWKDGSKSWIDVTPRWGRKMRITHQFLGTG